MTVKLGRTLLKSLVLGVAFFWPPLQAVADDQVNMLYDLNPPYFYIKEDGQLTGVNYDHVMSIMKQASLSVNWTQSNYLRLFRTIKNSPKPYCAAGYSLKPDRLESAQVVAPYRASSTLYIATKESKKVLFKNFHSIEQVIADKNLTGGFVSGAAYGGLIPDVHDVVTSNRIFVSGSDLDMARLVIHDRVDYVLLFKEQVEYFRNTIEKGNDLTIVEALLKDLNRQTYLYCSKNLDPVIVKKLQDAFAAKNSDKGF